MIQKIKLKNFQSLKDVTLSLGKVTVLIGKSDVGKSAVIRGLNAFFNNSFNQEYAHNGNLPFGVAIQKENKVALGRRTTKGVEYKFDSVMYSKTAKKIPQDISKFLGIYPYQIDVDMNVFFQIQKQFDQPFLLGESSTTVAKIIGRISNLNIVLMAMREMFATQVEVKQEVNFLFSKKKDIKNDLLKFSNFSSFEEQYEVAERLDEEIDNLSIKISTLENVIRNGESFNNRLASFKKNSSLFDSVYKSFEEFYEIFTKSSEIKHFLSSYEDYLQKKNSLNIPDFKAVSLLDDVISLKEQHSSISELVISFENLKSTNSDILEKVESFSFPNLEYYSNLLLVINEGSNFNERLKNFKQSILEGKALEEDYNSSYNEFMEGKVICPFSKLEMQDYCRQHLLK